MIKYNVTGMSCAACSARVEKAVNKVPGVSSCSVSLLTNSMGVEGTAAPEEIIRAVEAAGYGAFVNDASGAEKASADVNSDSLEDHETPKLLKRFIVSLVFLLVLMYFSMGHMMFGFPLPGFLSGNHVAMGLVQLLLTVVIMVINQKFFISGFKGLIKGAPNMDTLVALGSSAAFIYSVYALFAMTDAVIKGNEMLVMKYMDEFYFESAAMILTLITLGKTLEARSKGKTTDALKGLMKLAPQNANIERDGVEINVPVAQVVKGDIFIVKPGESIPVDGIIIEGNAAIDESALTGESVPVDKTQGDIVSASTINRSGYIRCEATRVGEDTTLSQIIRMISDAAATKAPIAKVADKVSGVFVPVVIALAVVTFIVWLLTGNSLGYSLARAISVLVISCPCALGLATPVAIMVGNGVGARHGIMFKTAESLEETGKVDIIALDKTGTITKGEPVVTDIITGNKISEDDLLTMAYSLELMSEHPLARAITEYGNNKEKTAVTMTDFEALPGNGLMAKYDGANIYGGNASFIQEKAEIPETLKNKADQLAEQGKTPMFFAKNNTLLGIIAVADVIKEDSRQAVEELKSMGIHVVMLTGDNERTARTIGAQSGVDEVVAGVLPDGKEQIIKELQQHGKVAMVGDGINDAPALTRADIGIAIGAGTDVAIDAADVVVMKSRLTDVAGAVRLSRAALKNIHENLFWAFIYNVIGIPLAAGIWIPIFGWELNPMFAAAAMSLSSFCVVTNALRLNLCKVNDGRKDKPKKHRIEGNIVTDTKVVDAESSDEFKNIEKGKDAMKTIKIKGMMCGHCEATVKKALEALPQVEEAKVSHENGNAIVTLSADITDEELKKAVEDKDYKVVSIK